MVLRLNVRRWRPVEDGVVPDVNEVAAACWRCRLVYSALVLKVSNSEQVTWAKYRKALPRVVVAVSKSLSEVSV